MLWVTLLQKMERRLPECPSENLKFMGMHSRRDLWTLSHSEMAAVMLWPQLPQCWLCMRFVVLPSQCPRPALDVAYSERLLKDLWSSYHPIRFKKKKSSFLYWMNKPELKHEVGVCGLAALCYFPESLILSLENHGRLHFTKKSLPSE